MTGWRDALKPGATWPPLREQSTPTPPSEAELHDAAGRFLARGVAAGPGSPALDVLHLTDREEIDR